MEIALRRTLHELPNGLGYTTQPPPRPKTPETPSNWIVQKFGGTSVGKFAKDIAVDIVAAGRKHDRIAIVCSAISSRTKGEGTTNRLLKAAKEAGIPGSSKYYEIVEQIRKDHVQIAKDNIQIREILDGLITGINAECKNLTKLLESAQHLEEVSHRAEDMIVSKGEKLSCRFMAALLNANQIPASFVDVATVLEPPTPHSHNHTTNLREDFYVDAAKALSERILSSTEGVPVITGFFGHVPGGLMTHIGRGYTDLCAALVAVGLRAKELQVWKEVDGIFTADPSKVPTSKLLSAVSPSEAAELTFYGSEVIHPFTMEQVIRERIPIRIKNVMNPSNEGTVIVPDIEEPFTPNIFGAPGQRPRHIRTRTSESLPKHNRPKRPTAITVKHGIVILNVSSNKKNQAPGFLARIFAILDKWNLSVDLISSSQVHVSLALHSETGMLINGTQNGSTRELEIVDDDLLGAIDELKELGTIDLVNNMAIISLVGKQLKRMVGISGKLLTTFGDNNINIEMISQGASEINISCVIDARQADRALNIVHTNLFTFLEP